MKNSPVLLFLAAGFISLSSSMLAATAPKPDARTAALIAALQAVSPDPLGGRLGLEVVSTVETPALPKNLENRSYAAKAASADNDRQSYLIWKSSQKS